MAKGKSTSKAARKPRTSTTAKPKATRKPPLPGPECLCGCGERTSRSSRRFRQGHDGRLKGTLIQAVRDARRAGDKAAERKATEALRKLGWGHFVPAA